MMLVGQAVDLKTDFRLRPSLYAATLPRRVPDTRRDFYAFHN